MRQQKRGRGKAFPPYNTVCVARHTLTDDSRENSEDNEYCHCQQHCRGQTGESGAKKRVEFKGKEETEEEKEG